MEYDLFCLFSSNAKDFNFVPQTYVLPHDLNQLKKVWDEAITRNKWIIKPVRLTHNVTM